MGVRKLIATWPAVRQLRDDPLGLGASARSPATDASTPRTSLADTVVQSVCPFCAVGCGQRIFVQDGEITQIEGDPDSPISRGRLCPKGAATRGLVQSPLREYTVKYRRPHGTHWEDMPLDRAMDMIAERVIATRRATWEDDIDGPEGPVRVRRTMGIGSLGGATLDNEENYLMKKLYTALGALQIENQARI
jgi:formate dehydrogenase major subunit